MLQNLADFRKSKGADVIQLLVSIYDTKEVFVKELQVLLAQRLLAIRDYSFATEVSRAPCAVALSLLTS